MNKRVIVVGGGPAGYNAALALRREGAEVTLIERMTLGGTCVNRGCVPTRSYLQAIKVREQMRELFPGEDLPLNPAVLARQAELKIQQLSYGAEYLLRKNKVSVEAGEVCRIGDRCAVLTDGRTLTCDLLILATGSEAVIPQNRGADRIYSSEELLTLKELPDELTIVGAGVLGVELAVILNGLNVKVRLTEKEKEILPGWDQDVQRTMRKYLDSLGIAVKTGGEAKLCGNAVFCCGREPTAPELTEDAKAGRGSWLYVIGDAAGGAMTADAAMEEGSRIAERIFRGEEAADAGTAKCVFTPLEAASVGRIAEPGLREGYAELSSAASGRIFGSCRGFVKAVIEEETHILRGVHAVSVMASEIVQAGQIAVAQNMTAEQLCAIVFPHPTEGELLKEAVRRAL